MAGCSRTAGSPSTEALSASAASADSKAHRGREWRRTERPERPSGALCTMCAAGPIEYDSQEETRVVQPAKACLSLGAAAVLATAAGAIQAQNYPTKTVKILEAPDVKASFIQQGTEPVGSTTALFAAMLKTDIERWDKVVRFPGARVE